MPRGEKERKKTQISLTSLSLSVSFTHSVFPPFKPTLHLFFEWMVSPFALWSLFVLKAVCCTVILWHFRDIPLKIQPNMSRKKGFGTFKMPSVNFLMVIHKGRSSHSECFNAHSLVRPSSGLIPCIPHTRALYLFVPRFFFSFHIQHALFRFLKSPTWFP